MRRKDCHDGQGKGGGRRGVTRAGWGDKESETTGEAGGAVGGASSLPVFLFPSELVFYSQLRNSHRRVLTLYNPYSFSLSFKMLCTMPSLYQVVESEGSVRSKSCIDLVVRHLDVSRRNWGRRDRFRMEVRGGGQVGGREIWAELRGRDEEGGGAQDDEERKKSGGVQQRALPPLSPLLVPTHTPACSGVRSASQWGVCVVVALLCVTVLMLPLQSESSAVLPHCLHVSTNQKLVCAYTLGLLTVVFLR